MELKVEKASWSLQEDNCNLLDLHNSQAYAVLQLVITGSLAKCLPVSRQGLQCSPKIHTIHHIRAAKCNTSKSTSQRVQIQ